MIVKFLNRAEVPRPGGGDACCLVSRGSSQICNGNMPRNRASFQRAATAGRLL